MGMPAQHTEWTAEMVRALPDDGKRYEVLDGELLVSPAPRWSHQGIVLELALRLRPYVERHRLGRLLIAPAEIEFSPRDLVEPDLFLVPDRGRGRPQAWEDVRQLLLVVEVLSPSTAHADRTRKRVTYQREGVPEYWIVDPYSRIVERWRPEDERPDVLADRLTWTPRGGIAPLVIDLAALFASATD